MGGVKVRFYGGVGEIGGNKVVVEDRGTKIFLDHGRCFHWGERFYVNWLMPRDRAGLRDIFEFDLMPKLPGLYAEPELEGTGLPYQPPQYQGIFISHIHYDHVYEVRYVDPEIPIHLGETALMMLRSWETTSPQMAKFGPHEYRPFRTGHKIRVDGIEVEPIHVDHSTPGAYGFLIHTSEGTLVYSGDLRRHGPHGEMTEEFVEAAEGAQPTALLLEGTRVAPQDPRENLSETEVRARIERLVSSSKKLAITTFYGRDVDRMRSLAEVAEKTGRTFVFSTKDAHLLEALQTDPKLQVPQPFQSPHLAVYQRVLSLPRPWERAYEGRCLGPSDIRAHPERYILHLDFNQLTELVDIQPPKGSLFIRSMSEPFEEDDVEEAVLQNWLSHFELQFHPAHASGHGSQAEIFEMAETIQPKALFPIHTEHPELFAGHASRVELPGKERTFFLD